MATKELSLNDCNFLREAETVKFIIKTLENMTCYGSYNLVEVYRDVVTLSAVMVHNQFAFYDQDREEAYLQVAKKYSKDDQYKKRFWDNASLFTIAVSEFFAKGGRADLLGKVFHEIEAHNVDLGQFYTPYQLSKLMAEINTENLFPIIHRKGYCTVLEPACGTGGMTVATYAAMEEKHYEPSTQCCFFMADLDERAVYASYLQMSALNAAAAIECANTLANETYFTLYTPRYVKDNWHKRLSGKNSRTRRVVDVD